MADENLSSKLIASIDQLSLSSRTANILKQSGVQTITDLLSLQREDLLEIAGFTPDAMTEVREVAQTYLLPLAQQYSMVEVGKAIREIKQIKGSLTQVTPVPDISQIEISLDDPLHTLALSVRARNVLIRNGIKTIKDLLSISESEIASIRNVGTQTFTEIQTVRKDLQSRLKQPIPHKSRLSSSETTIESLSKTNPLPQNHLLVRQLFQIGDDSSALLMLNSELSERLNNAGVNTDKDLLQSRLYQCAGIKDVSLKDWEEIFKEFKHVYRGVIQQVRKLPIQKTPPYEIEKLGLNKRATNRLLFTGVTDLQQIIQLTFADILAIKEFGPLALGELLTILQSKSDEINFALSIKENNSLVIRGSLSDPIINKLVVFGINDLTNLEQYTVEDLILKARLTYYEVQQVSEFLSTTNITLSTNWPEQSLVRSSDYQFLKQADIPLDSISVSRLALPTGLEMQLRLLQIETIDAVARQSKAVLKTVLRHHEEYIDILTRNLKAYLTWLPTQNSWDDEIANQGDSLLYLIWLKETTLEKVVDNLLNRIPHERNRKVIRLRFGLDGGGQRTLEQVGEQLDLTRERIRQIEKRAFDRLKKGIKDSLVQALYSAIADEMEARGGLMSIAQIREPIMDLTEVGEVDLDSTISLLLSLRPEQFVEVQKNKRWGLKGVPLDLVKPISKQLIKILKAVQAPIPQSDLIEHLSQSKLYSEDQVQYLTSIGLIEACLSTDDYFEKIGNDQWGLAKWQKRRIDEIVMALYKLGRPSHFTKIAEVANEMLPPSQRASARVYHAQLSNKPHLFVWVGSGTFGLTEWGLKKSRFYVDIAEELLQNHDEPLSFEEIFPVINAEREASPESIKFMLGTNYRFRQYPDNKYGLASWVEELEDDTDDDFLDDLKRKLFDDLFEDDV